MRVDLRILLSVIRHRIISFLELAVVPMFLISSFLLIGLVIWKAVVWFQLASTLQQNDLRIHAENAIMATVAQIFGGAFVLIGIYFTAKSVFISREGQITDRFSQALENLSDTQNIFKRIGGIHALERIARDSPYDHWAIMEIFTDYVRTRTTRPDYAFPRPESDIQAILNALGRRNRVWSMGETKALNLKGANLEGADLRNAQLAGASLSGAKLRAAILFEANLEGADLAQADLEGANLNRAWLSFARLYRANLQSAQLRKCKGKKTTFAEAQLQGASLDHSYFVEAVFTRANLHEVSLESTKLVDCYFDQAVIEPDAFARTTIIRPVNLPEEKN